MTRPPNPRLAPVKVGIVYIPDASAWAATFGVEGSTGDTKLAAQAAVTWANNHGGLAGHKIEPVFEAFELTSSDSYAQSLQRICASFVQDHHVVAAIFVGANVPDEFPECLQRAGVLFLSGGFFMRDRADYERFRNLVSPYEASSEKVAAALVNRLLTAGTLKRGDHAGIMIGDWAAPQRTYRNVIEPRLRSAGIKVTAYTIQAPGSTAEIGNEAQEVQSAQLRMRADGVTVVMFWIPGPEALFMNNAESQDWHPRYALTSYNSLWLLNSNSGGAPDSQLRGATGIGWMPTYDVGTYGVEAGPGDNATRRLCRAIEKPTGQVSSNTQEMFVNAYCDAVLFLHAAAGASESASVTGATLLQGFNSLGRSHPSAITLGARLSAEDHAGAGVFRSLAYVDACGCFKYTSGDRSFR